jgi:hypothetical protein
MSGGTKRTVVIAFPRSRSPSLAIQTKTPTPAKMNRQQKAFRTSVSIFLSDFRAFFMS